MKVSQTELEGVLLVEPRVFGDGRGWFVETYQRDRYREHGIAIDHDFVQDNHSSSTRGTLRGLHYRLRRPQGKLVWVTRGSVRDVVVDIRPTSPAFCRWIAVELSADNLHQLWVPPGFAHGFLVTSDVADVQYKVTSNYDADDERTIAWNDPRLAIAWEPVGDPILSVRDRAAPQLRDAELPP
jgi:dTDP-4-dehydrorhamnose 3,5-epimerase